MKGDGKRIVCLTAYDAITGALADRAGADVVLVGDSVGNTALGYETTLPVTLEEIEHHVRATRKGVDHALLVADMPFGSYGSSVAQAVDTAARLVKAGADAVKLEGSAFGDAIAAIRQIGVPVMGHVGMTPQSVNNFGGFRVQGKGEAGKQVLEAAHKVADAGAFSIVLELIPATLSAEITQAISVPTIGIGAGPECDGEIQVIYDILGLAPEVFRHTRAYVNGSELFSDALSRYVQDVREKQFPSDDNAV